MIKYKFNYHKVLKPEGLNILIAGCVIASILINGLMVKVNIDQNEYELFKNAFRNQSAILELFTLSSLPINLVYKIFYDGRSCVSSGASRRPSDTSSKTKKNTSADYSLVNDFTNKSIRTKLEKIYNQTDSAFPFMVDRKDAFLAFFSQNAAPPVNIFIMLILAMFVLLPRGSIEYIVSKNINRQRNAQLKV
ncbi:MAG: hypothetical protein LHV68_04570 [Elusimicrobia bacterium]|nr:hypothetical protein [Candidatus Liberimonas magnetica]